MKKPDFYKESVIKDELAKKIHTFFPKPFLGEILFSLLFSSSDSFIIAIIANFFKNTQEFNFSAIFFSSFVIITTLIIFYLEHRKHKNKSIEKSKQIHDNIHFCRDKTDPFLNSDENDTLATTGEMLCQNAKRFFEEIKNTSHIGVAIRISGMLQGSFVTLARSGLSQSRRLSSEPLKKGIGVAKQLLENDASGCIIYRNVKDVDSSYYKQDKNDSNFNEVVSMIAAPINNCSGMIGILYISSKKENLFSQDDVEYAKAFADYAAILLTHKLYQTNNTPAIQKVFNKSTPKKRAK
jgi:transcriptional regulator with GAF, ATPase, and Fis domain